MIKTQTEVQNGSQATQGLAECEGAVGLSGVLDKLAIAAETLRLLPADFIKQHRILPFKLCAGTLHIATADPGNQRVIDDIRLLSGLEVEETVVTVGEVSAKISECYRVTVEQMVENLDPERTSKVESKNLHDIEVMANEPTVINLVNLIISTALKERTSDIHLVPFESTLQLRYRVDGLLHEKPPPPKQLHAALVSRIKIMADMNIAERYMPQDGHIQINHRGVRVDIRVGTMPTIYGESLVMRLLEKGGKLQTPVELGLDVQRAAMLSRLVEKPHGLFLTTGPTGSGKTTTLYAILQGIYTPELKILTIEDPVEYELPGVAQIPVRPSRNFTFATGLRAILRQDPDVVMVGEIRDSETAEIAIRAALTGHQVFSTLHTNDSTGAVTRLIDMGVEPFLVASSVMAIMAQRLIRVTCSKCKETYMPDASELEHFEITQDQIATAVFNRGKGCSNCQHTGYRGRVAVFELMVMNSTLREMTFKSEPTQNLRRQARLFGMKTLVEDALGKALLGKTTLHEVYKLDKGGH